MKNDKKTYTQLTFFEQQVAKDQYIYEDELVVVLCKKNSILDDYVLVVPKRLIRTTDELKAEEMERILEVVSFINTELGNARLSYVGYDLFSNNGEAADQSVPQLHFHFIPIYEDYPAPPIDLLSHSDRYNMKNIPLEERQKRLIGIFSKYRPGKSKHTPVSSSTKIKFSSKSTPASLFELSIKPPRVFHEFGFDMSQELLIALSDVIKLQEIRSSSVSGYHFIIRHRRHPEENLVIIIPRHQGELYNPLEAYNDSDRKRYRNRLSI